MTEKLEEIRRLCTCGLHGSGVEVEDTPRLREILKSCPATAIAGSPETREDWLRKVKELMS